MNFYGSLVIEHIKPVVIEEKSHDFKFSLILPLGIKYEDAHAAVLEMAEGILAMQKNEQEQAAKNAAEAASPVEVVEAEVVSPEITD